MKSSIAHRLGLTVAAVATLVTLTSGTAHAQNPSVVSISHVCTQAEPLDTEVYIFFNPAFGGACAGLFPGLYPTNGHFGLPNDSISSIKVGSRVRARLFWDGPYAGNLFFARPGHMTSLGGWDNQISSIRVEFADRSENCGDIQDGEIGLFRDAQYTGDCMVLPGNRSYPTVFEMGIANDSVSSVVNRTTRKLRASWNENFNILGLELPPFTAQALLSPTGFNDHMSSVKMVDP